MKTNIYSTNKFTEERNKLFLTFPNKQVTAGIRLANASNNAFILEAFDALTGEKKHWSIDPKSYASWLRKVSYTEKLGQRYASIDETALAILNPKSFTQKLKELEDSLINPTWQPRENPVILNLTEKQKQDLSEALRLIQDAVSNKVDLERKHRSNFSLKRGGMQWVIKLEELPHQVFKFPIKKALTQKEADEIVRIFKEGQEVCLKNQLNHLYVPETQVLEFENQLLIVQEKLDVTSDGTYQRDLFRYISEHPKFRDLYETLIDELAKFIILFQLSDVKWDNNPFIKNSRVLALYDLDRFDVCQKFWGLFTGVLKDNEKKGGLYSYIFDKELLLKIHASNLNLIADKGAYLNIWNNHSDRILNRIERSLQKRKLVQDFHAQKEVKSIESSISKDNLDEFQQALVDIFNESRAESKETCDAIRQGKITLMRSAIAQYVDEETLKKHLETLLKEKKIARHTNELNKNYINFYT